MYKKNHNELKSLPALNTIYSQHRNNSLIQCGLLQILCLDQSYLKMCSAVMFKYVYKWKQCALSSFIEMNWIMCHYEFFFLFFLLANALAFGKPMAFSYRDKIRGAIAHHAWTQNLPSIYDEEYMITFCARTILLFCTSWGTGHLFNWNQVSPFTASFHRGAAALEILFILQIYSRTFMCLIYWQKTDWQWEKKNGEQLTKNPHGMNTYAVSIFKEEIN